MWTDGVCLDGERFWLGYVFGGVDFVDDALLENFDAFVIAYYFDDVTGKKSAVSSWNIVSEVSASDGGYVYSRIVTDTEGTESESCPGAVFGYGELGEV